MVAIPTDSALSLPERIAAVSRRPATLGQVPPGAISLAMGEPDGDTPAPVVEAAIRSLRAGRTHYSPITGSTELRRALAGWVEATGGRPTAVEEVVPTHGAAAGLAAIMLGLLEPGDRVIVPEPTYSLYADHLAMAGAECLWVAPTADGRIDLDRIAELAPQARMVIVCNPSNPTGGVLDQAEQSRLAAIVEGHPQLLLVSDEAYGEIVYDGFAFGSALALETVRRQTIVVGTFSKSFAMTGWRLGYAIAAPDLAARIGLVHRTINGSLNTFVQDAAIEALKTPADYFESMRAVYQHRCDLVISALRGMDRVTVERPGGAFYAFPRVDCGLSSAELVDAFAAGGVLVRSGAEFGPSGEGHVRISFATDEESLTEGLRRFGEVVAAL